MTLGTHVPRGAARRRVAVGGLPGKDVGLRWGGSRFARTNGGILALAPCVPSVVY